MWVLIIQYQFNKMLRYFEKRSLAKSITVIMFLFVFAAVAVGIYLFFVRGLSYINTDPIFGRAVSFYSYELYLLFFSGLVVFSTFIAGLFGLFKGQRDAWVMSSPKFSLVPRYIFIHTCLNAIWPFLIIILPILLAMKQAFLLSISGFIMMLFGSAILTILTVGSVLIILSLIGLILKWLSRLSHWFKPTFRQVIWLAILLMIALTWLVWANSINIDLVDLFHAEDLSVSTVQLERISDNFKYFPSHLLAQGLIHWQLGEESAAVYRVILLLILTFISTVFWWWLAAKLMALWMDLQVSNVPLLSQRTKVTNRPRLTYRFAGGQIIAIFKKESLVSSRHSRNLMWFGFLLFIWLIQTGVNTLLSWNIAKYHLELNAIPIIIQVLQFVTAVYFISAFVLRFVFPAFSSERRTAWILASAPINMKGIFWAKYLFFSLILALIGILVAYSVVLTLDMPFTAAGPTLIMYLAAILFIVALGLSLGARWPNYETDDPGVLSTTLTGLIFIVLSLLYGSGGGYLLYLTLTMNSILPIMSFVFISLILVGLFLYLTPREMGNQDFVKIYS